MTRPVMTWEPGDFAVVQSRALVGEAIEWMQHLSRVTDPHRTGWVHAFIGMPDGDVVEAEPGGTVRRPFHYDPALVCWSTGRLDPPPTQAQRMRIIESAQQCADRRIGYSGLDYLAIAARQWHLWAPGLRDYIKDSGHMQCSQETDWCYARASYHLFRGRWAGYVRPYDLAVRIGAPPV